MEKTNAQIKEEIINAGYEAIDELIKVAKEKIIKEKARSGKSKHSEDDDEIDSMLAADRLKSAAQAKKMAIFDAFEILSRIESEKQSIIDYHASGGKGNGTGGFAERRSS